MSGLTFNEAEHRYFYGEMELPSVTTALSVITDFSMIQPQVLERARVRGVAAHRATELDDLGTLDESSLSPVLIPYLDAWRLFRLQTGFIPENIEERVFSLNHLYAGTLDRIGISNMGASIFNDRQRILIDIKARSVMTDDTGPQLAAYAQAWLDMTGEDLMDHRYSVQLKPDGKYKLHHYQNVSDLGAFFGCLAVYNWRNLT